MLFKLLKLAKQTFVTKNFRIGIFYIIYLINVMKVVLEIHARCQSQVGVHRICFKKLNDAINILSLILSL